MNFVPMLALVFAIGMTACTPTNSSRSKFITDDFYDQWQATPERLTALQQMIQRRGHGVVVGCGSFETGVMNEMAKVPQEAMAWLIAQPNFFIECSGVGDWSGESSGVTQLGSADFVTIAISGSTQVLPGVLLHELGHAVQQYLTDNSPAAQGGFFPSGNGQFVDLANQAVRRNIFSSYASSYLGNNAFFDEAWAESFASYYFSPQSLKVMREQFPEISQFFSTVLPPPAWESPAPSPTGPFATPSTPGTNPTTPIAPPAPSRWSQSGLFVMIPEQPALNTLQASAPPSVQTLVLCFGSLVECSKTTLPTNIPMGGSVNGQVVTGTRLTASASAQTVYEFTVPPDSAQMRHIPLALLGYDASGSLVARRQVILGRR
jgi:hypothetical protein